MSSFVDMTLQILFTSIVLVAVCTPVWILLYYLALDFLPRWLGGIIAKGIVEAYSLAQHRETGSLSKARLRPLALMLLVASTLFTIYRFPSHWLETSVAGFALALGMFWVTDPNT